MPDPTDAPDPLAALLADPPDLPLVAGLDRVRQALTSPTQAVHALTGPAQAGAPQGRSLPDTPTSPSLAPAASAVVVAPPGTGKTTLVPPLVASLLPAGQRVVLTQPRRVAARAAARRIATLLGEQVGRTVGYSVRGERHVGPGCRIEVVTAGLLLRRLQHDPGLDGVGVVILDEVHERSLDSDLLTALLLDARALREDLTVVAMSATADLTRLPTLLGEKDRPAPVIEIPSPIFPVQERWAPPPSQAPRLDARGVPRAFLSFLAQVVADALEDPACHGDVLAFAPGAREVDAVVARLREIVPGEVDVYPLHGRLPAAAQDAALAPSRTGRRRVVVATDVAESSLTVPGVAVVVDSTLSRVPRLDLATGVSELVTVGVSRASGIQRAGRAGRQGPGTVIRCCSPTDWARAPQAPTPEILSSDLTRAALELVAWGAPGGEGLRWLDPPPAPAMGVATDHLIALGLVEQGARTSLTALGRRVVQVPADVGPARALVAASALVGPERACRAVALLTADLRADQADLTALWRTLTRSGGQRWRNRWREETRRLAQALRQADPLPGLVGAGRGEQARQGKGPDAGASGDPSAPGVQALVAAGVPQAVAQLARAAGGQEWSGDDVVGLVAALAYPQWICRRRGRAPSAGEETRYVSVSGVGMRLPAGSPLAEQEWLAVAEADRTGGRANALVRAAAPISADLAQAIAASALRQEEQVTWSGSRLRAVRTRLLGAIELETTPLARPTQEAALKAVVARCRQEGLEILPWGSGVGSPGELRARLDLLARTLGEPWPAMDDASLLAMAEVWLAGAFAQGLAGGRGLDLERLDLTGALRTLLPWPQAARLDELVPERVEVPSGAHVRLRYTDDQGRSAPRPILAVRVQECFGWRSTPRIVDGRVRVLVHLLSPARRPVAVTDDLRSFWEGPYQQVRKEMRGRYPKHAWPEDPWNAPARAGR